MRTTAIQNATLAVVRATWVGWTSSACASRRAVPSVSRTFTGAAGAADRSATITGSTADRAGRLLLPVDRHGAVVARMHGSGFELLDGPGHAEKTPAHQGDA